MQDPEAFANEIAERMPTLLDLLAIHAPHLHDGPLPSWYAPSVPRPDGKEQGVRGLTPAERQAEWTTYTKAVETEWPWAWARAVLEARPRA
jgi:hypothetical protein